MERTGWIYFCFSEPCRLSGCNGRCRNLFSNRHGEQLPFRRRKRQRYGQCASLLLFHIQSGIACIQPAGYFQPGGYGSNLLMDFPERLPFFKHGSESGSYMEHRRQLYGNPYGNRRERLRVAGQHHFHQCGSKELHGDQNSQSIGAKRHLHH